MDIKNRSHTRMVQFTDCPDRSRQNRRSRGFTLIELLVVISIIALLIGILLPALESAKHRVRVASCLSGQRQLSIAMALYASEFNDQIPRGPSTEPSFVALTFGAPGAASEDEVASSIMLNQSVLSGRVYFNSHGVLLDGYLHDERSMFCPGDNGADPSEELEKVRQRTPPAFSSYVYRQLDQAPNGQLTDMGRNDEAIEAIALIVDSNSVFDGFPGAYRTNHNNHPANVSYTDGHAKSFPNAANEFSLTPENYFGWTAIEKGYNRIFQNSDRSP